MGLQGHERCVSRVPIFSHLEMDELEEVFQRINHQHMKKGEFLFMAGDRSSSLYVIHKGKVRVYRLNDNGEEQLIRVLAHSDFTGELSLFSDDKESKSYAEVLEDAQICRINREDIYGLMQKYPDISIKIIESFAERLNDSELLTTNISLLNSKEKLIEYIRTHTKGDQMVLTMTKKNLASYLSMQPETLTRTFNKLEDEGYVRKINNKTYDILKLK
ncbi:Crp/Fnr family transcriptional regulator [Jeotgalicoccus coquinae]|uniref:HTH-type transcriptional regulator ArcR n=1 Tax=Jeotgalicoccus coquinae TaxID=709509 RepID=A0A6V7R2F9_9STAP|nr:Crp/Fnr family transcriptional regulator [Jeotgalicoccus coquinae]MBB6423534.1 CRP/FNR family transcriptional regulator [Jeotgalicoccus coquinae]GGE20596.1 Crp/Fnr family transcriptional regulator [Jeotgalicoccus coquinae]CAD2071507.1 Anaerobic regulatory protein [Jeotgalicoccus coquinae]